MELLPTRLAMPSIAEREKRVGLQLQVEVSGQDAKGSPFAESSTSVNISGGGICFASHENVLVGQRLTLHIQLPENLRKHFGGRPVYRARAVVCRVERFEGSPHSRIGCRFLGEVEA
jgi:hypothetical protein